ncbi:hypothetical protein NLI96_g1919 [Meripilus lineatus]|uniref:Carbonic anhydrase n=1 Tax=Meripilus lineatus TaxID=2056292 RepID=A0AAD5VF22_9APHY|nr:hypothetical protein NLI96_g1919 [Physisporinus lineatus]
MGLNQTISRNQTLSRTQVPGRNQSQNRNPGAKQLLKQNADWASKQDPKRLLKIAEKQTPKVAWFGCSDSRVPESVITRSGLGHIFVHRNIAKFVNLALLDASQILTFRLNSQFHLNDLSAKSVLVYAVDHVEVDHIIIVGHTKCGGVSAAFNAKDHHIEEPLDEWLKDLTALGRNHTSESALVEANIHAQVANVLKLLKTRKLKKALKVRGWLYKMETGRIHELVVHDVKARA